MAISNYGGYLSLTERLRITCTIRAKEPLHIGSGKKPVNIHAIDQPVVVDRYGRPIIPGSTIKGFLRNYLATQLLSLKYAKNKSVKRIIGGKIVEVNIDNIDEKYIIDPTKAGKLSIEKLDPILKIFGSPSFSSLIKINEASPPKDVKVDIFDRTHVSIDIGTGKAKEGALVTLEYVPKDTVFEFRIYYDKLEDKRFEDANKLFLILLDQLIKGIEGFIGGWKSRGYGLVELKCKKIERIKINEMMGGSNYIELDLSTLVDEWLGEE